MTHEQLRATLLKPGYGLASAFGGKGLKSHLHRQGKTAELERRARPPSIRPPGLTIPYSGRCVVRIKSYRQRLTDPLGDCTKYHIDGLRYQGFLADDNEASIRLIDEGHERVATTAEERVEITIEYSGLDLNDLIAYYKDGPRK